MNVLGNQVESRPENVLPMFNDVEVPMEDPMEVLVQEAMSCQREEETSFIPSSTVKKAVRSDQFPDQSMYVLDEQLAGLKESLRRLNFYIGDLDDLITK